MGKRKRLRSCLGKAHREVQNPPKRSSKTMCPLIDEKEDAKGYYLGAKTL